MPTLARHKVTGTWFNDFQDGERSPGDVLANVVKAGLNPADFDEVEITLAQYRTEEAAFFAAARAAQAIVQAAEDKAWASAKTKLLSALTAAEQAVLRKRVFGEE